MIQFILAISAILAYYIWKYYENVKRYPKGPTPLPFIGNILQVQLEGLHIKLADYGKEFGGMFTIWLPGPMIVITEYDLMKEALNKIEFAGRLTGFPDNIFMINSTGGVAFSQGDVWKEQRRVSIQILRDFGMGRNLMEDQVRESIAETLLQIDHLDLSEPVDLLWPIQIFVANVINKSLFGYIYKYDDCDALKNYVLAFQKSIAQSRTNKFMFLAQTFPWIEKIPILGYYACGRYRETVEPNKSQLLREVEKALKDYDPFQEPECFTQAYYQKMQLNPQLTMEGLHSVCFDFFNGGTETTSTTLRWATLYMAKYQDVQEKCREEIRRVLGDQQPSTSLKNSMPYCCATINEIQRICSLVPLSVNHRTTEDTFIGNVKIPDNTVVIPNIWNTCIRSEEFPEGEKFMPERFISEDGNLDKAKLEKLIPFGIGKRICAGEGLARVELFIGFVSLLQRFKISPVDQIDLSPIEGVVLMPKPHKLKLTRYQ